MYLGKRHTTLTVFRTTFVFALIIALLLWFHFKTPIPPYPEGGGGPGMGLEVNLGVSDEGEGNIQAAVAIASIPDFKENKQVEAETEKLLTSEEEESEKINNTTEEVKKKEKPNKKIKKTGPVQTEKVAENKQQQVIKKALFQAQDGTNQGNTGKPGDEGNPNGTEGSKQYTGNGDGSGGGNDAGSGNGSGNKIGNGISFSLDNRKQLYLETPEYNYQAEGKVVVEITVDKNGKVINAVPGVKGSTTLDDYLLMVAKKAAFLSKFNRKPDAVVQKGTITYNFLLQ